MAIDKTPRVCISAGHGLGSRVPGSVDPGAKVATGGSEAAWVLGLAKNVYADLIALGFNQSYRPGAYVMLRDGGYYSRADDDAVKHACDLFIELHLDSGPVTATGTSALYESAWSHSFATNTAHVVSGALGIRDRGAVYRPDLAVLNPHPGMVSIILEVFFASSKADLSKVDTSAEYRKLEVAIVNSILRKYGWKMVQSAPRDWGWTVRKLYRPY